MKILFLEWNSFCTEDMIEALVACGHTVFREKYMDTEEWEEQRNRIDTVLEKEKSEIIFTFNYFPEISEYCMEKDCLYFSWVYDSPYINILSYTAVNPCNRIFLFDYGVYQEMKAGGISTVYYLPLAVNPNRLKKIKNNPNMTRKHTCDVAFVGSMYTEKKHDLYSRFCNMDAFSKGYLDGIMNAQLQIYGQNFLQELLTKDIIDEMQKYYPTDPNARTIATPEYIYTEYVLNRRVTAMERRKVLSRMAIMDTHLYTHEEADPIPGIKMFGPVDYYDEMPYVFKNARINLNITLRSIKTGIPLRAFDIMGNGGFLLTNYQEEFLEYFKPDQDFVYYENIEDAVEKAKYYLQYPGIREKIAERGKKKVYNEHTFEERVKRMIMV